MALQGLWPLGRPSQAVCLARQADGGASRGARAWREAPGCPAASPGWFPAWILHCSRLNSLLRADSQRFSWISGGGVSWICRSIRRATGKGQGQHRGAGRAPPGKARGPGRLSSTRRPCQLGLCLRGRGHQTLSGLSQTWQWDRGLPQRSGYGRRAAGLGGGLPGGGTGSSATERSAAGVRWGRLGSHVSLSPLLALAPSLPSRRPPHPQEALPLFEIPDPGTGARVFLQRVHQQREAAAAVPDAEPD